MNVKPPTPINGGNFLTNEMGVTFEEEDRILDILSFTFDPFKYQISQER